ncbi:MULTISPECIES: calcium-binding protein [unclassified Novosphingobium]|uniref:beta strand repeat-containing protein n=1 Tax=unclassified Novosphingobium TaxID=2644732 RepID=UPI0025D81437|nr:MULTISPECIES: calcium-binding protein [unclassified Novosphingobium]HQV03018.1 calcium-binding protein [Novosphingobium sp.]
MPLWNNTNSGLWTDSANWSGGVPNGSGAIADIVVVGGSGATIATFTENTTVTLGTLNVTSTGARDVLFQGSLADSGSGVATLSFDAGAIGTGVARVNVTTAVGGGEFEISSFGGLRVSIGNETEFNVATAGTTARINAPIIGNGSITKLGAGTLQLGSSNTTFGGIISVEGGTLSGLNGGVFGTASITLHNNAILRTSGTLTNNTGTTLGETGTTGSGQIMAPTGTTLTMTGNFGHRSSGVLTLGNIVDNGTIAIASSAAAWGDGSYRLAGGTIRFDNAFSAASAFFGANTALTELVNGVILDGHGFQMKITNLDLDNGTIRSSTGSLLLLVSDTTISANAQTGTIEGTANADKVEIDVTNNFTFASTTFTNWSANDVIQLDGGANDNSLTGTQFKDLISGFGGNDTLIGGGGADVLNGGDGDDLIIINANNGNSQILGGIGTDTLRLTGGTVTPFTMSGIEAIELQNAATLALSNGQFFSLPSNAAISGTGTISVSLFAGQSALTNNFAVAAGSNITFNIQGAGGNETITVHPDAIGIISDGGGNDLITGGNRGDTITIAGGVDTVNAGAGNDLVAVWAQSNGSHVNGGTDTDTLRIVNGSVSLGTITGFEGIDMTAGTTLNLTNAQFTSGFASNSALSGTGTIAVSMVPGDVFFATGMTGGANVTFNITGSTGVDVIKSALGAINVINGGDGIDQIRGGFLGDTIDGGIGNDKIMGLAGSDILTGGDGADQFRYLFTNDSLTGSGADQIMDFQAGTDTLDFRALDANPNIAGRQTLTFIDGQAFHANGTAEVRWADLGADLRVYVDLDGNGTSDMEMLLVGAGTQTLTATDFVF